MRKSLVLITLATAVLAGCGGGSSADKLRSDDVAVVGKTHVTQASFDALIARAKRSFQQQGQAFPKQGTTRYQQIKSQAVSLLVQQAELEDKAKALGIKISDSAVDARLALIKKQYFGGSEQRYLAQIKKQGYTNEQVREDVIRPQLISEAVQKQIEKDIKISDSDVHAYYVSHSSLYSQPQTRDVRYILVGKSKATADSVYQQLAHGTDKTWCTLAKKYAKDASGQNCGKATFSKGETVAVFDQAAFSAPAGKVVKPFFDPTRYKAWFVIEPLGPVKPKSTTPEKQVAATIRQTLLDQKKQQAISGFQSKLTKTYCSDSHIRYATGYVASPDPCAATTSSSPTTTG